MIKWKWIVWIILISCTSTDQPEKSIEIQGHRGARGLAPENSLSAFILATDLGVNTLELDLVVSKDSQLVVSHEPFFSPEFCLDQNGNQIAEDSIINIYQLTYAEIMRFDCGSKGNPRYPDQKRISVFKPLLSDVIDSIDSYTEKKGLKPMLFNIELKTTRETDSTFHPTPDVFSDLVYDLLTEKQVFDRVTIQSFDFRTLQYFNTKYPEVALVLLIENELDWRVNIDSLGFTPEIYSPYYKLVSQEIVKEIQDAGIKVIPWTVNDFADLKEVKEWGVDGIITDYPDRALTITKER